jgi:hypothetical protein
LWTNRSDVQKRSKAIPPHMGVSLLINATNRLPLNPSNTFPKEARICPHRAIILTKKDTTSAGGTRSKAEPPAGVKRSYPHIHRPYYEYYIYIPLNKERNHYPIVPLSYSSKKLCWMLRIGGILTIVLELTLNILYNLLKSFRPS